MKNHDSMATANGLKIVICDDHSISQLGIQCALQDYYPNRELKFLKVLTGKDAIELVKEHSPDLLTLDLHLPDMAGIEVLKTIRNLGLNTKILILTSEESLSMILQLLRHNASAILLKSYSLSMFDEALKYIEEDSSGRTFLDSSLEHKLQLESEKKQLSSREFEVLQLVLKGHTNKSIASLLGCSPETIKTHRSRIMEKTETRSRSEVIEWSQRKVIDLGSKS